MVKEPCLARAETNMKEAGLRISKMALEVIKTGKAVKYLPYYN
jgi:hypothetical protein